MKTREEAARGYTNITIQELNDDEVPSVNDLEESFLAGIEWLESQASEGFQEWFLKNLGKPTSKVEFAEMAWQAARLSAQKEIAEKDARIKKLSEALDHYAEEGSVWKNSAETHFKQLQDADKIKSLLGEE